MIGARGGAASRGFARKGLPRPADSTGSSRLLCKLASMRAAYLRTYLIGRERGTRLKKRTSRQGRVSCPSLRPQCARPSSPACLSVRHLPVRLLACLCQSACLPSSIRAPSSTFSTSITTTEVKPCSLAHSRLPMSDSVMSTRFGAPEMSEITCPRPSACPPSPLFRCLVVRSSRLIVTTAFHRCRVDIDLSIIIDAIHFPCSRYFLLISPTSVTA